MRKPDIQTGGFYLFGVLTALMAVLKLSVFPVWSWWRVSLPVAIFLAFNAAHIVVGLIYLSVVTVKERPEEEQDALLENHGGLPYDWISLLCLALFADNIVRWWEHTEESRWMWFSSGEVEVLILFGGLSVVNLFLYWSRIGRTLNASD
jgi:hypothetical protein